MPDVACASSNHPFSASAFADTRARETDANCNGSAAVQVQARNEDARVDNCRRIPFVPTSCERSFVWLDAKRNLGAKSRGVESKSTGASPKPTPKDIFHGVLVDIADKK